MTAIPERAGVLGGGRMGAGIAHALLMAGSRVTVLETDEDLTQAAFARVVDAVGASARRGTLTGTPADTLHGFTVTTRVDELRDCGLVVEAVPEDLEIKAKALSAVAAVVSDRTVLASNTSSLPISELAALLPSPQRVLGLHFFNPVPASLLVEVVLGPQTDPGVAEAAVGWVHLLGKTPIVVRDSPGFASSRLGLALGLEAIRMVEEGVASAGDIDAAMELGYKHPTGPLKLTDLVGLDVRLGIAEHLERTLGARFAPPQLLRDMVARGDLGRKTGQGFYRWED
jgi:3-hydroxybutyryl-CoA dehydrogenase